VTSKYIWCGVLIVALSVTLSTSAEAQTSQKKIVSNGTIAGVLVGGIAAVVIVTYVVIHESTKKRTITGCVTPEANGMSVTDEKDKRSYALSGNTADIKAGDRLTLQGKKIKPKDAGKPVVWETKTVSKDFGVCRPAA
jgi:putative aminopeptidase FrvX